MPISTKTKHNSTYPYRTYDAKVVAKAKRHGIDKETALWARSIVNRQAQALKTQARQQVKRPQPVRTREGILNRLEKIERIARKPTEKLAAVKQIAAVLGINTWQTSEELRNISVRKLKDLAINLVIREMRRFGIRPLDERQVRKILISMREGWIPGITTFVCDDMDAAARAVVNIIKEVGEEPDAPR